MKRSKRKARLRPRHVFAGMLVGLLLLAGVMVSQTSKLEEIQKQQESLTAQLNELTLEEQRLEHMLEYAQTDEYLQQYVREKLGYLGPNDYKFYIE